MSDRLTDERLAELDEMERAATPGPWRAADCVVRGWDQAIGLPLGEFNAYQNADLTVAARNALRPLLDKVRELEAELANERHRLTVLIPDRDLLRAKIAELEGREMAAVNGRREFRAAFRAAREKRDAREAQLAEMRRDLEKATSICGEWPATAFDPRPLLDRYAIPTTPPEAEESDA